jgi:hypothetical protein
MKDPAKQIADLNAYVKAYYSCNLQDGEELSMLLQKITGLLYFLETVRSEVHKLYESKVFELVGNGNTVARSINEANVEYPQMYQLRRIMDGGYRIADAIRTNISYLKSEKQHAQ